MLVEVLKRFEIFLH
jgi:hypothetical protein